MKIENRIFFNKCVSVCTTAPAFFVTFCIYIPHVKLCNLFSVHLVHSTFSVNGTPPFKFLSINGCSPYCSFAGTAKWFLVLLVFVSTVNILTNVKVYACRTYLVQIKKQSSLLEISKKISPDVQKTVFSVWRNYFRSFCIC
jgi:hypothetical protein